MLGLCRTRTDCTIATPKIRVLSQGPLLLGPLANFEPFYQAFGVNDGDGMFLPEEERVEIW